MDNTIIPPNAGHRVTIRKMVDYITMPTIESTHIYNKQKCIPSKCWQDGPQCYLANDQSGGAQKNQVHKVQAYQVAQDTKR